MPLYIAIIAFVAASLVFIGIVRKSGSGRVDQVPSHQQEVGFSVAGPQDSIKAVFSRAQIQSKLRILSESPAPTDLGQGAMCYKKAGPPEKADYVCPVCNSRTHYTLNLAQFVDEEIRKCRAGVASIKGISVKLMEEQFCRKCAPQITAPQLCLSVHIPDDSTSTVTCGINYNDIELISEFLAGKTKHDEGVSGEVPLKDFEARIRQLLGLSTINK